MIVSLTDIARTPQYSVVAYVVTAIHECTGAVAQDDTYRAESRKHLYLHAPVSHCVRVARRL